MTTSSMVVAPAVLNAQTRLEFRSSAFDCLERILPGSSDALTIDMSVTRDVDACGLGVLVLVTKRARERGMVTRLLGTAEEIRSLLLTTRLEPLFQFRSE